MTDPALNRLTLLAGGRAAPAAPLAVVATCLGRAIDPLLAALRAEHPDYRTIDLPAVEPAAEEAVVELWADLPADERAQVAVALGRHAVHLRRFADRPTLGYALLGRAPLPGSMQARMLLGAAYPDTWTLALDRGPVVDADRWRHRLATILSERWEVGLDDHPIAAFDRLRTTLGLRAPVPSAKAMFGVAPDAGSAAASPDPGDWLDVELVQRIVAQAEGGDPGAPTAAAQIWEAARLASLERRVRMLERRGLRPEDRPPAGGPNRTSDPLLLVQDASEAAARMDPKVLRGRAGRLFLATDSHDSHAQLTGGRRLERDEVDAWSRGLATRAALAERFGARYAVLIGPAPQVVHSEDLPARVAVDKRRPVKQVLEAAGSLRGGPPVVYPLAELAEVRRLHAPFPKTDSHWNDLGAFVAYEALADAVGGGVPMRRLRRDEVAFHPTMYEGDLGSKLRPERAGVFLRASLDSPQARLAHDNRVRNHARHAVYECPAAPAGTCVVFGDSWAYGMLLFLAESFRRTLFYHRVNVVDAEPIERERPDLVLTVLTERFMTAVPDDAAATPFEAVVAKKLRGGQLVPEQPAPGTRAPFLHSVSIARELPPGPGLRLPA